MRRVLQAYFNLAYNPVYDFTTARLPFYQRFQKMCLDKLEFEDNDSILCIGVGTGNEIIRITGKNPKVRIWGIDSSRNALNKAYKKALPRCQEIKVFRMDAHKLEFNNEQFSKVVCIHVMGFLGDDLEATRELLRVLRKGGQFVATYPFGGGSMKLAAETMKSIGSNLASAKYGDGLKELLALLVGGIVYLPASLGAKPKRGFYSSSTLKAMFDSLKVARYWIEAERSNQDFIVYGKK